MKPPENDSREDSHRDEVEEHIKSCPDCSARSAELDRMIDNLSEYREVFCPDSWELYEFADTGNDPGARIARHIDRCAACREKIRDYTGSACDTVGMPPLVLNAFRERVARGEVAQESVSGSRQTAISDFFTRLFRTPVFAFGAVAAAILLAVLIYPRMAQPPLVALSDVAWKPKLVLMGGRGASQTGPKPRVAAIILFEGFDSAWPQDRIDGLYEAMRPTHKMRKRFRFLSPLDVKKSVAGEGTRISVERLMNTLRTKESADYLLLLTMKPLKDRIEVQARVLDCATGKTLGELKEPGVDSSKLPTCLKDLRTRLVSLIRKHQTQ